MKPLLRNRALVGLPVVLFITHALHAEDLSFSGTGTVRMLATDWADYIGGSGTFNASVNDGGRLFWRGSAGDGQYMHFNLSRLSGLTVTSPASVTLQNTNDTYGGGVSDSFIATANSSWSASYGSGIPGATAIGDATNATGSFPSNTSISWSIGSVGFQSLVDSAATFQGLAIIGGSGSQMHFNGPLNPYLEVGTSGSMSNVVTVSGGAAWNSSNYSFVNGVLSINDTVAGGTSGAGAVTVNALGTVFVNGNGGDNRYWAIDSNTINAGGVLVLQGHSHLHNLTLAGGELGGIRPSGTWGGWSFDDATTVTGGGVSTLSAQQLNLDNGGFVVATGSTLDITGSIRSGSITQSGGGSIVISGWNSSNGGITINGGTFTATRSAQDDGIHTLGYGPLTVNNGGTLRTTRNWTTSSEWNGNSVGTVTINQGGTWSIEALGQTIKNGLNLNGGSITSSVSNADWGALHLKSEVTAGGNAVSSVSADTALNWMRTFTVEAGSQLNYSGVVHNQFATNGGITKTGTGTLVLSGANSYSGQTVIAAGTLLASSGTALGPGGHNGTTMSFIYDGATLALQGGISLDEHFHVWGSGVGGLGAVRSISGNNALTNSPGGGPGYCLRSNTTVGVDADSLAVSGFYQEAGSFSLTKIGAGTLTLTAPSNYDGGTSINSGTLVAHRDGLGSGAVVIGNGGTLYVNDQWVLSGGNQYGEVHRNIGTLTINAGGTLHLDPVNGFANGATNLILNGGSVTGGANADPRGALFLWNGNEQITAAGGTTSVIGVSVGLTGNNNTITVEGGSNLNITGALKNSDWFGPNTFSGGFIKAGSGTLSLSGGNTYSGATSVNGGTLRILGYEQLPGGGGITIGAGATLITDAANDANTQRLSSAITLNGGTLTAGAGTSAQNFNSGNPVGPWGNYYLAPGASLQAGGNATSTITASLGLNGSGGYTPINVDGGSTLQISGDVFGVSYVSWGAFTKTGAGTLVLSGYNKSTSQGMIVTAGTVEFSANSLPTNLRASVGPAGYSADIQGSATLRWAAGNTQDISYENGASQIRIADGVTANFDTNGNNVTLGTAFDLGGGGTGAVTKSGSGKLTLSSPNAYTGTTTVNGGTLSLGTASLGDASTVSIASGAVLELTHGLTDTVGSLIVNGTSLPNGSYNASSPATNGYITGTGSIQVGPSDPFLAWIDATWPSLSDKTEGGDPDHDGMSNLLEYVLKNGDPSVSNPVIVPTADASGANFIFTYYRRNASTADTTQTFEYGTDLDGWTPVSIPGGAGVTVTDQGGGIDKVEISVAKGSNTSLFGRLRVVK